jgi:RNA polymerase sigma-70 factor (ECF subfamily)
MQRYQEIAFRVALLITGSPSDAEEAAQDGFVKAYFALGRFRSGAPFRPWLLQIVANEARNRRLASARRFALSLDEHAPIDSRSSDDEPESLALGRERAEELIDCVNKMRDDDRNVLALRYFLDLSESEMAASLKIARGTVKSRLSRALARMRACLTRRQEAL